MAEEVELENITKPKRGRPPLPKAPPIIPQQEESEVAISAQVNEAFELYPNVPKPLTRSMELKRHYRPMGEFEIVGYNRPEIKRKGPDGKEVVVQEAAFIPDEMAPSPMPGVDVKNKVWATTVIRVPVEEARTMRTNGIADATVED